MKDFDINHYLDEEKKIKIFPVKQQKLKNVVAYIAEKIQEGRTYTEKEINEVIKQWISAEDHITIRRYLYDFSFISRTSDGSKYWRIKNEETGSLTDTTKREAIVKTLGKMPERVPLDLEFGDKEDRGEYYLQSVFYDVSKGDRIKSLLLIPKNRGGKLPAIVACHQHAGQYHLGKCEPAGLDGDVMYFYGMELAKRGFVVICPDHLGFEERKPSEKELEKRLINGAFNERELFCSAVSNGSTLQAKYTSDLCAAVDVLTSLDYVDSDKIGTIGHSLGGQEVLWLTFMDKRIKAGVSSCGFSTLKAVFDNHIPHNFAMFTYDLIRNGDNIEVLSDIAQRGAAFMMTNGTDDKIFPLEGIHKLRDAAEKIYEKRNEKDKYISVIFKGEHSFPDELREQAYEFLEKYLKA